MSIFWAAPDSGGGVLSVSSSLFTLPVGVGVQGDAALDQPVQRQHSRLHGTAHGADDDGHVIEVRRGFGKGLLDVGAEGRTLLDSKVRQRRIVDVVVLWRNVSILCGTRLNGLGRDLLSTLCRAWAWRIRTIVGGMSSLGVDSCCFVVRG